MKIDVREDNDLVFSRFDALKNLIPACRPFEAIDILKGFDPSEPIEVKYFIRSIPRIGDFESFDGGTRVYAEARQGELRNSSAGMFYMVRDHGSFGGADSVTVAREYMNGLQSRHPIDNVI
jgi:hypothetical protein